jgi:hypothetical protein
MSSDPPQTANGSDLSAAHRLRAFLLAVIGCVIGLGTAGVALFQAKGTTTFVVPADAVAIVNQQPISRIDYAAQLRALGLDPQHASAAERRKIVENMVREELFVQRGKELDVALVDPEVRSAMVRAVEAQAAATAITNAPGEPELRAFYEKNRSHYANEGSMALRDLVFPATAAGAARQALAAGAAIPAVLGRFHGTDTGRLNGEEFYFAARIHLGPALFEVARPLRNGEVSSAVPSADGAHVLVMGANRPPQPIDFNSARARVTNDYQDAAIARYQTAEGAFLRRRANVLLAPDVR